MSAEQRQEKVNPKQPPQEPPAREGVIGAMMVAVLIGAMVGVVVAAMFLPDLMAASALGGAMIFGAARVFIFMSSNRRGLAPIDEEDGTGQ